MSLTNFLSIVKNKRLQRELKFVEGYRKVHNCSIKILYHDNGLMIIDADKGICIIDLLVA